MKVHLNHIFIYYYITPLLKLTSIHHYIYFLFFCSSLLFIILHIFRHSLHNLITYIRVSKMSLSSKPLLLIIADSHGRNLYSTINTHLYDIRTCTIPGLQWLNRYDSNLSLRSLVHQEPLLSLLRCSCHVIFMVGTNSVRTLPAGQIIDQIDEVLHLVRFYHPHLDNPGKITIIATFPCLKISNRFRSIASLKNNIFTYNTFLLDLSYRYNFFYLDLNININFLSRDNMHIDHRYKSIVVNTIINYIHHLNYRARMPCYFR